MGFRKALFDFPVFSLKDIKKLFPNFDNRKLVEWQNKNYIIKLRREYYCFEERKRDESFHYIVANKIYTSSYISMESALSFYSFIPEGVFVTTNVSTRNTTKHNTPLGDFNYYHIKTKLFFGYKIIHWEGMSIRKPSRKK